MEKLTISELLLYKIGDRIRLPEDLYGKYCYVVDIGVKIFACDKTTWLSLDELEQEMGAEINYFGGIKNG